MEGFCRQLLRWLPLILVVVAAIYISQLGFREYLTFEELQSHRDLLLSWVQEHYGLTLVAYVLAYILVVALSIPGATILTLLAGFLFGYVWGFLYVLVGATIGAFCIYLIVQHSLGKWLADKNKAWVTKLQSGFQKNATQYLLFLRLVPLFPFSVVNVVSGVLNVDKKSYLLATFFGIMPGSFVYVWFGRGLSQVFDSGRKLDLSIIFQPFILGPLLGLSALSLLSIFYKKKSLC